MMKHGKHGDFLPSSIARGPPADLSGIGRESRGQKCKWTTHPQGQPFAARLVMSRRILLYFDCGIPRLS